MNYHCKTAETPRQRHNIPCVQIGAALLYLQRKSRRGGEDFNHRFNTSSASSKISRGTPDSLSRAAGTGLQSPGGPDYWLAQFVQLGMDTKRWHLRYDTTR